MKRNYKEEYKEYRRNVQNMIKTSDDPENTIMYMSFTKYGKSIIKKENEKFLDDANLDYELGILDDKEYSEIKLAHMIIEKSICNATVY